MAKDAALIQQALTPLPKIIAKKIKRALRKVSMIMNGRLGSKLLPDAVGYEILRSLF